MVASRFENGILRAIFETRYERRSSDARPIEKIAPITHLGTLHRSEYKRMENAQRKCSNITIEVDNSRGNNAYVYVASVTGPEDQLKKFWSIVNG